MRVRVLVAAVALPLVLWGILPIGSAGQSAKQRELSELQSKIDRARSKIGRKKGAERVLTTQIAGYSRRIRKLQGRIGTLSSRQQTIEADLAAKRAELERLQSDLRAERARLVRLRSRLDETRTMLRARLVEIYKAGKPDFITVVLNSDGFADLLERGEFIARISEQDRKIVKLVTDAKADATRS
jgi:peptidoglycan hydrolase CwlO-like protein